MIKDWRGVEIQVGDRVVYPGRAGSSIWMTEAEVLELLPGTPEVENYWDRIPHRLRIKRLRESGYQGDQIEQKEVLVQAKLVTVVASAQEIEFNRYPMRYMIDPEIESEIEIDGRAT